jgi:hypothetical protein
VSAPAPVAKPPVIRRRALRGPARGPQDIAKIEALRRDPLCLAGLLAALTPNIRAAVGDVARRYYNGIAPDERGRLLKCLEAAGQLYVIQNACADLNVPLHTWLFWRLRKHLAKEAAGYFGPGVTGLPYVEVCRACGARWTPGQESCSRCEKKGQPQKRQLPVWTTSIARASYGVGTSGARSNLEEGRRATRAFASPLDKVSFASWWRKQHEVAPEDVWAAIERLPEDPRAYARARMAGDSARSFGMRTGRTWRQVEVLHKRLQHDEGLREARVA